jgi:hemoglobin
MEFKINQYKLGDRPEVTLPDPRFYALLQEDGMRKMVNDHYDLLVKSTVKALFPTSKIELDLAKQHSADFMIQICGGPKHYQENRGKPLLIKRHAPFSIPPSARLVWLNCYIAVLSKLDIPEDILSSFWNYLNVFSSWMVNTEEEPVSQV